MQNNQSKLNTILLVILIVLVGVGVWYMMTMKNSNTNSYENAFEHAGPAPVLNSPKSASQTETTTQDNSNTQENVPLAATSQFNWNTVSQTSLAAAVAKDPNLFYDKDLGLTLSEQLDLTGDGIPEAIINGSGGNSGITFILIKNNDGSVSLAKQKNQNSSTSSVSLWSVGTAGTQMGYKFFPSQHGFYIVSLTYNQITDKFDCDGFDMYVWNSATKLFEWNASLTATYRTQVCI